MLNDTEQIILATARKHFLQKGYAGARLQEIADEAGINKAMLHYYFRSKDKLYEEITKQILDEVIPRFTAALGGERSFWEKIELLINTYTTMLLEQPDIPFFIMSELSQKRENFVKELKNRSEQFPVVQGFMMQMMQEMAQGKIRTIPPHQLFLNIVSMSVFPFLAKPIFGTLFDISDGDFQNLMIERKAIILEFVKNALRVD